MPVQDIPTLKGYFEAGDKPTEGQFGDLIDSCHNSLVSPSGSAAYDDLVNGNFVAAVSRLGGSATVLANPSTGVYTFTAQEGAHALSIDIDGNSSVLDTDQLTINYDNSANSRDKPFSVSIVDKQTNKPAPIQTNGTLPAITFSGNITTLVFPGMNNYPAQGFRIELR